MRTISVNNNYIFGDPEECPLTKCKPEDPVVFNHRVYERDLITRLIDHCLKSKVPFTDPVSRDSKEEILENCSPPAYIQVQLEILTVQRDVLKTMVGKSKNIQAIESHQSSLTKFILAAIVVMIAVAVAVILNPDPEAGLRALHLILAISLFIIPTFIYLDYRGESYLREQDVSANLFFTTPLLKKFDIENQLKDCIEKYDPQKHLPPEEIDSSSSDEVKPADSPITEINEEIDRLLRELGTTRKGFGDEFRHAVLPNMQ